MFAALAPAALGLAALATAPAIIHLLTRRRSQVRPFPALALLARIEGGRSSRRRLREWAVLAMRTLALAAAALAAAGLLWRGSLAGLGERPAVIVLDGSASMRQVVDGAAIFSRARAGAGRLIDEHAGRRLSLLVSGPPARSSGAPTTAHGLLRSLLSEVEPGFGDGDPAASLAAACELLGAGGGDCYLITDMSRGCMAGIDPAALPKGVELHLVDAGGGAGNVAVVGLTAEPGVAVVGRPVTVSARVANYGASPRHLTLDLRLGPHAKLIHCDVPPGGVTMLQHTATFEAAGAVAIDAELIGETGESFTADDRRIGQLSVLPAITTVLASDADRDDSSSVVHPLVAALTAAGLPPRLSDGAGLASDPITGTGSTPALLITAGLRSGVELAGTVKAHLESGGAWLQVVASDGDAALGAAIGTAAPATMGARIDVSDQERGSMAISQARLDHPLLSGFLGRESLLTAISAYRYRLTPAGAAADAAVLWAYGDGTLAMCERPVGAGRWLQLNCSPAAADSTLSRGEVLPLLIAQLPVALLPARNQRLSYDAGSQIVALSMLEDDTGAAVPSEGGRVRLSRPGLYRWRGGTLAAAAVPALESDLRRFDPAVLKLTAASITATTDAAHVTPLWPWLLALTALALAGEMLLAGGLGRHGATRKLP